MKIQMTLYCENGTHKPMSTLVEVESLEEFKNNLDKYKHKAISKISAQRYMSGGAILKNGYTKMKWRIYNPEERKAEEKRKFIEQFFANRKK